MHIAFIVNLKSFAIIWFRRQDACATASNFTGWKACATDRRQDACATDRRQDACATVFYDGDTFNVYYIFPYGWDKPFK
jgi:hypothetical protein